VCYGCCVDSCTPILIQQHIIASSISFNRSWDEYKHGFGDTGGNYWIGNNVLTWLTAKGKYKLRFDLQQRYTGKWYYAEYSTFREGISGVRKMIASECEKANETTLVNEITEKVVKEIKEEIEEKISGVKNETNRVLDVLENVVNAIKTIASNQQKTADELREVKRLNVLVLSQVKVLLASNQSACECVNSTCPSPAAPVVVKQALVSALVCEYQHLLSVINYSTDSTLWLVYSV